jgi:hypothetical protein
MHILLKRMSDWFMLKNNDASVLIPLKQVFLLLEDRRNINDNRELSCGFRGIAER